MSLGQTAPVIIVSADSHVGPRLREDLRGYCPARHLDDFDALIAQTGPIVNAQALLGHPNAGPGHYDPAARLVDMDSDGVAAEVIYHGSQNGEPLPWGGSAKFGIGTFDAFDSSLLELSELGAIFTTGGWPISARRTRSGSSGCFTSRRGTSARAPRW